MLQRIFLAAVDAAVVGAMAGRHPLTEAAGLCLGLLRAAARALSLWLLQDHEVCMFALIFQARVFARCGLEVGFCRI